MSAGGGKTAVALCLEYPLADRGGVSVLVDELCSAFASDFAVHLVSPDQEEELRDHPLSAVLASHISYRQTCHPPKPEFAAGARRLAGRLAAAGVKLAHFHAGGTYGWGNRWPGSSMPHFFAAAGIRSLWTDHLTQLPTAGFSFGNRRKRRSRWLAPLARAGKISQMRCVAAEIAVSDYDKFFMEREFPGGSDRLLRLYHSRLDSSSPVPSGPRRQKVLAVGHLAYRKGQDILAQAFLEVAAEFPGWELEIVGHDSGDGCRTAIERLCANHPQGGRVILRGAHPRPFELMAEAAIFVQPSLEEALPLALQEAIFNGCPAIGTHVGGVPEEIDDGETGFVVPKGQVPAIAGALRRLMGDPALRDRMSGKGRASIEAKGMTRDLMVTAHRELYHRVLA